MRVLLIQAVSSINGGEAVFPLGLARLAAEVEDIHEVKGIDLNLVPFPWTPLKETLKDYTPDVVGVSFRNLDPLAGNLASFVPQLKALATFVRTNAPEAKLVIGGSGFSLFAQRLMREIPEFDYGLVGEGDQTFRLLLDHLDAPATVPGVITANQDVSTVAFGRETDLDRMPLPCYHLFPPENYLKLNRYVAFMGIETKRGCPYHCSYCLYPLLQGGTVRLRDPRLVVNEIEYLIKHHGVGSFHFTDAVLNFPPSHLESICQEILRRGLKVQWTGFFREDHLTARGLDLYAKAGLSTIYFSGDGASESALKLLNKGFDLARIKKAAKISAASGLITVYHFLVNLPEESRETAEESRNIVDFLLDIHKQSRNPAAFVFNNLRLYPGAPLTRRIMEQGLIDPQTDLLYPVYFNPPPYDGLRHDLTARVINPADFAADCGRKGV